MNAGSVPNEQKTPQATENPALVRLAVFRKGGEQKQHVATLTLKKPLGSAWTLEASGPSADELSPLLQRFSDVRRSGPEASPADALTHMLISEGFIVEELPAGDHQINVQIDLRTGKVVGTHVPMHSLATGDEDVGRRVFEAIEGGLSKFANELAEEIDEWLAKHDVLAAAAEIKRGLDQGLFGLPLNTRLLEALMRIDIAALPPPDRRNVRDARLITAQQLQRFEVAGFEADFILSEDTGTLNPDQIATLKMTSTLGALRRGHRETALATWRGLLKEPSHLKAEERGWAWRNIAAVLSDDDPEARRAAQYSSDAFLEAGNKLEAGKSLMRLANILMRSEPAEAVKALDEMVAVLDNEGLDDRYVRGAALHARAYRLAKLHRHKDAFGDAVAAVEQQRGLLGAEAELISSLHLAAIEARIVGETARAEALTADASKLTHQLKIAHFQFAERVVALAQAFDATEADDLLHDAEAAGNLEIVAGVSLLRATMEKSLTDIQRLQLLEEVYTRLKVAHVKEPLLHPVSLAIAKHLISMGELQRATEWFRRILERDPFDTMASASLVNTLWKMKKWGDAATFIKRQLDFRGDHPVMLYAYGRSLLESGEFSGAIGAFTRSLALASNNRQLKRRVRKLRDRAFELGGTLRPPPPLKTSDAPVTRAEFEAALDAFGRAVSAMRRMAFWRKERKNGQRPWIERPERKAQDLLHMYLQAKFDERAEPFEEITAGAGRIDLYLKVMGGLSIIIEIKMCGGSYSSTYAAAGEEQITHYMENKNTRLGYLVVFDGRARNFGKRVLPSRRNGYTVLVRYVDVRPEVKQRSGKKKRADLIVHSKGNPDGAKRNPG
jgi:tetratricopeptide (TPR) repeat protein